MIKNKKYFIDQINSSKAYQFICMYHYSHMGFKKSKINLGIFNLKDNKLVGVLQFGCSAAENIKLNRYVKEPIKNEEYLELNRFAMADSEEHNSESMAISLGLKWIKKNCPNIRLIVSYSGRVEGNYGYIYQATNWEYLGYFLSSGFWKLDGKEYHNITISLKYKKYGQEFQNLKEYLCDKYNDVRSYVSKQFIYIQRIDKTLTPANEILPYPKPKTDYPIQTKETVYKENIEYKEYLPNIEIKEFFYKEGEQLFTTTCLKRRGEIKQYKYALFDKNGDIFQCFDNVNEIRKLLPNYNNTGIYKSCKNLKKYKDYFFRKYEKNEIIPSTINVNIICYIDNIPFYKQEEIVKYVNVTRQAVSACVKRKGKTIGGKKIIWEKENITEED